MLRNSSGQPITLAGSVKWFEFPQKFERLASLGFAFEYTPDSAGIDILPSHLSPYLAQGIAVRHHGFFPGCEIADPNHQMAEDAMGHHFRYLEKIAGYGEQVVTIHIGLDPQAPIEPGRAVDNLGRLVEYGNKLGVTVSLENLRRGPASNLRILLQWVIQSGAGFTLDLGHVISSERARENTIDMLRIIKMFEPYLIEVHYYEKESDRHYPPRDMQILGPVVEWLLRTECSWWTVELGTWEEIAACRNMLRAYLRDGLKIIGHPG